MDTAATNIFRPGKMWRVLEGSYYSRLYSNIIVRILHSVSKVSQVDKAFCFNIIVCGHHAYRTAVWTPQKAGEMVSHSPASYCRRCGHFVTML